MDADGPGPVPIEVPAIVISVVMPMIVIGVVLTRLLSNDLAASAKLQNAVNFSNLAILTRQIQAFDCPANDESDKNLIERQQSKKIDSLVCGIGSLFTDFKG